MHVNGFPIFKKIQGTFHICAVHRLFIIVYVWCRLRAYFHHLFFCTRTCKHYKISFFFFLKISNKYLCISLYINLSRTLSSSWHCLSWRIHYYEEIVLLLPVTLIKQCPKVRICVRKYFSRWRMLADNKKSQNRIKNQTL